MRKSKDRTSCKEIQMNIVPFIQGELSDVETEAFIDHVNACSDCREEYDVYYTLLTGMMMLEEGKAQGKAFASDSGKHLLRVEEGLIREKMRYLRRRLLLVALIALLAFAL